MRMKKNVHRIIGYGHSCKLHQSYVHIMPRKSSSQKKLHVDIAYVKIIGFTKKPFIEIIPMPPNCQKRHFSNISELRIISGSTF